MNTQIPLFQGLENGTVKTTVSEYLVIQSSWTWMARNAFMNGLKFRYCYPEIPFDPNQKPFSYDTLLRILKFPLIINLSGVRWECGSRGNSENLIREETIGNTILWESEKTEMLKWLDREPQPENPYFVEFFTSALKDRILNGAITSAQIHSECEKAQISIEPELQAYLNNIMTGQVSHKLVESFFCERIRAGIATREEILGSNLETRVIDNLLLNFNRGSGKASIHV